MDKGSFELSARVACKNKGEGEMRWQHGRRSTNIQDRRGSGVALAGGGGGVLLLALLVFLAGGDPTGLLIEGASRTFQSSFQQKLSPEQQEVQADFVSVVLGSTEDVWQRVFEREGWRYTPPVLVLFSNTVDSACGTANSAVGPFYCPLDRKIYLDLNFFHDLEHQLDAPGDFARAYVIAHEVGHHIQETRGILEQVRRRQQALPQDEANRVSVRAELQADCLSGVWAAHAQSGFNMIEAGDIEEALNAASQIGDDRLQQRTQGYVVPDAFTHGSAEQRYRWFNRGFQQGDVDACDTFAER
jgi:predicted metalloprotease